MKLKIIIDGRTYEAEVQEADDPVGLEGGGPGSSLHLIQSSVLPTAKPAASSDFDEAKVCRTPLAGVISRIQVSPGQHVEASELLLVLEAMKMEIKVAAERAGTIKSVEVKPGDAVRPHQILVFFA
jgi:methylmalonyl-CoA carboxyltransferase 1.3S subunit